MPTGDWVPQHFSARQRSWYWLVLPAPAERHDQPVLGSLPGRNTVHPVQGESLAQAAVVGAVALGGVGGTAASAAGGTGAPDWGALYVCTHYITS